jgi:hypothetical protein
VLSKPFVKLMPLILAAAAATAVAGTQSSSSSAAALTPIEYVNKATPGPQVIVIPGEIKAANLVFSDHFRGDNIADFAEIELGKANFKVLERSDLGPVLQEFQTAYNLGDPQAAHKILQKGRLKTTKYILRFDILKVEQVAAKKSSINGATATRVIGSFLPGAGLFGGGSAAAAGAGAVASSVETSNSGGTWTIGMRYKVIDANTTEQVAADYIEDKVEIGSRSTSVAGISTSSAQGITLDSVVQHLIQECVYDIDSKHK